MKLTLDLLPDQLAVCRLPADSQWPEAPAGAFAAVTRTSDEMSVVCVESDAPAAARVETGWRALRVRGLLAFEAVGVIASLSTPLASAGVPIFVISTFNTDYLLVKTRDLGTALAALRSGGHQVDEAIRR